MTVADTIFMFFSRTYENDVNKKILDDRNFVIPKERLLTYVRNLLSIPYQAFLSYISEHPLGTITSRNITQCSSFAACEIELCQGMLALNNPGLSNIDVGHLFPKYVTSRTEIAFVKYGENQAKTGMQLGLTFNYFGYWYLSCIGYVYGELTHEEKLSWLARALLRDELYSRIVCDCLMHNVDLLDYMDCLSSDSTKLRRHGCVEYLALLCLQECDKGSINHYSIQGAVQTLKKKRKINYISTNSYYGELADNKPYLPINIKRRYSRCTPITLDKYKQIAPQPVLGRYIPNYSDLFIYNLSVIPDLTEEEETFLFERAKAGDSAARDAIIESVLPAAIVLAFEFLAEKDTQDMIPIIHRVSYGDMVQYAALIVCESFEEYNPTSISRFSQYALANIRKRLGYYIVQEECLLSYRRPTLIEQSMECSFEHENDNHDALGCYSKPKEKIAEIDYLSYYGMSKENFDILYKTGNKHILL